MWKTIKHDLLNMRDFFLSAIAEKNDLSDGEIKFAYKLSLGRVSWLVWFVSTIWFTFNGIMLSYLWYLVGLSCLGYVIGSKFIVTNIGGANRIETASWENEEHV